MKHIIDDADKNKYEAYSKEEVLEVIQEAISSGELPEEINGLVITLKNPIDNNGYKIAFCTQAKYNELQTGGQLESNCYYFIIDDTTMDDLNDELNYLRSDFESLDNRLDADEIIISGKVDASKQSGDIKIDIINDTHNEEAGMKAEDLGGDDEYTKISVKKNRILLEANNGDNQIQLVLTDDDIVISQDDGTNSNTYSLTTLFNYIPVSVPISNDGKAYIKDYGSGLYLITVQYFSGGNTRFTTLQSIDMSFLTNTTPSSENRMTITNGDCSITIHPYTSQRNNPFIEVYAPNSPQLIEVKRLIKY